MNRQTRLNCVQPLNDAWRSLLLYLYSAAVVVIPNDYGRYIAQAMLVANRASLTTVAIPSPTSVKRTRTSAASVIPLLSVDLLLTAGGMTTRLSRQLIRTYFKL